MIFPKQYHTRCQQLKYVKHLLDKRFDKLHPNKEEYNESHKTSEDDCFNYHSHHRSTYVAMELANFVNPDDNSIRGFKTKCTASFTSEAKTLEEILEEENCTINEV